VTLTFLYVDIVDLAGSRVGTPPHHCRKNAGLI
jgi:hypothetical protein